MFVDTSVALVLIAYKSSTFCVFVVIVVFVFVFFLFFFFKQKTAYDLRLSLVGSEMCIRVRGQGLGQGLGQALNQGLGQGLGQGLSQGVGLSLIHL